MNNIKDNINYKLTSLFIKYFERKGCFKKKFIVLVTNNYHENIYITRDIVLKVEECLFLQHSLFSILKFFNDHNIYYDNISDFNFDNINTELDLKQIITLSSDTILFDKEYMRMDSQQIHYICLINYLRGGIL